MVDISLDYPTVDDKRTESTIDNNIPESKTNDVVTVPTDNIVPVSSPVQDDKFSQIKTHTAAGQIWNSELTIAEDVNIEVPGFILSVCNYLRAHTSGNEFSILCKGYWNKNTYIVTDEYVIPIQKVDRTSVYYDDVDLHDHRSNDFNVVIHCHPFNSASFSTTDSNTINAHFECSILYSEGAFTTAVIPIQVTEGLTLQMKPKEISINWETTVDIPQSEIDSKISIIKYVAPVYNRNYYDNYNYGHGNYYESRGYKGEPKVYGSKKKPNSQIVEEVIDREHQEHSLGWHNGVRFPLTAIDDAGCVVFINDIGKSVIIPYVDLPENVVYDDVEQAFISEEFLYNAVVNL